MDGQTAKGILLVVKQSSIVEPNRSYDSGSSDGLSYLGSDVGGTARSDRKWIRRIPYRSGQV